MNPLIKEEEHRNGRERLEHFEEVVRQCVDIGENHLARVGEFHRREVGDFSPMRPEDEPQDKHRHDGADRAERDEPEAVVLTPAVGANGRDTDAERHDERHGHGTRRHPAGVERDRPEGFRDEEREDENNEIKDEEQVAQADPEQHAQHRDDEERTDPGGDREDQRPGADGRYIGGEHLQIGLRDRDERPDAEGHQNDDDKFLGLRHTGTHVVTHGGHRHLRPEGEQPDPDNEQEATGEETEENPCPQRHDGEAQDEDNERERQYGYERFAHFFFEDGCGMLHRRLL